MRNRVAAVLAAAIMAATGLAVATPAQAAPQDVRVTSAFVLTDTIDFDRGAHRLTLFLSEPIPLGVHGTVTASACGRVLGTMPFVGHRPNGRTGDAVDVMVNGVLVTEYGYTIRFSDPTMPTLQGTQVLDPMPSGVPTCEQTVPDPTSTDFNEAPGYNEVPSDYLVNHGKTKVNGKRWRGGPYKVGDRVKVTDPRLSIEAKAYAAKVSYEWTLTPKGRTKGKVVATGSNVKVKRSWKGKYLAATVLVADGIFKHPYTTYAGGGPGLIK